MATGQITDFRSHQVKLYVRFDPQYQNDSHRNRTLSRSIDAKRSCELYRLRKMDRRLCPDQGEARIIQRDFQNPIFNLDFS